MTTVVCGSAAASQLPATMKTEKLKINFIGCFSLYAYYVNMMGELELKTESSVIYTYIDVKL